MTIALYDTLGVVGAVVLWVVMLTCLIRYPNKDDQTRLAIKEIYGAYGVSGLSEQPKTDPKCRFSTTLDFNENDREVPEGTPDFSETGSTHNNEGSNSEQMCEKDDVRSVD